MKSTFLAAFLMAALVCSTSKADVVFSTIPGPYVQAVANDAAGLMGTEDYDSGLAESEMILNNFRWVGGVNDDGDAGTALTAAIQWNWFDADGNFAGALAATLPEGFFIWTLTAPADFVVPTAGFFQTVVQDPLGPTASWFTTSTAPSPGTSPGNPSGLPPGENFSFEFDGTAIPEPGSMALFGLIALGACTLRRRK